MKKEREYWTRLYHKTLKGLETMIDVQRMVKDIKKMAEEANTMIIEVEGLVLTASINNGIVIRRVCGQTSGRVRVRTKIEQ